VIRRHESPSFPRSVSGVSSARSTASQSRYSPGNASSGERSLAGLLRPGQRCSSSPVPASRPPRALSESIDLIGAKRVQRVGVELLSDRTASWTRAARSCCSEWGSVAFVRATFQRVPQVVAPTGHSAAS
jgi:hypothetical protein